MISIIYEFLGFQSYNDYKRERAEKGRESLSNDINEKIAEREQKIAEKTNLTKKFNDDKDVMNSHLKSGKITQQEHAEYLKQHKSLKKSAGIIDDVPSTPKPSGGITDAISDHPILAGAAGALGVGLIAKKLIDNKNRKPQYA